MVRNCSFLKSLYFKGIVLAAMTAALLIVVPQAQAQQALVTITKTANPSPATVGQPIIFTITDTDNVGVLLVDTIIDELPPEVTFVSGTFTPAPLGIGSCTESPKGTVGCGPFVLAGTETAIAIIKVIPRQCGTFTNTATSELIQQRGPQAGVPVETPFTVNGCQLSPLSVAPGGGSSGSATPVTQDFSQNSESGDSSQTFNVS